ncbi:MAG: tetratricopeptide repeat protein [Pseudomonadales bacterium]|nr:tetratricopeptide repeat protein [Pseudomonadales bacterium]
MRTALSLIVIMLALLTAATGSGAEAFRSANEAVIKAQSLIDSEAFRDAEPLLEQATGQFPDNQMLAILYARTLVNLENIGLARKVLTRNSAIASAPESKKLLTFIDDQLEKFTRSRKMAIIVLQKATDAGNYDTSVAVAEKAIAKFPNDETLYTAYGRTLLETFKLEEAEQALRQALKINPKNVEARKLIEEIRATADAQTSVEVAEWISIAKDKVNDFVVTFLALFAAFVTNSLVSPIALRYKLNRARKAVEEGNYDDFTDLLEGMLDEENFAPLRANFRFLLRAKSYEEARDILNKYVNTLERLPTLLRILEREHEKMLAGE